MSHTLKHLEAAPSPFRGNMSRQQMTYLHPEVIVMSVIHTHTHTHKHTMHRVIVAYCWSLNNTVTESLIKENKETAVRWIERTEIAEPLGLKREKFCIGCYLHFQQTFDFFFLMRSNAGRKSILLFHVISHT